MRNQLLSAFTVALLATGVAHAQACGGYPAAKSWTAGGVNRIHEASGGYPGWVLSEQGWASVLVHAHPVTVAGVTAQTDSSAPKSTGWSSDLHFTTEGSGWTLSGGQKLSLTWKVYVSDPGTHEPSIETEFPQIHLCNGSEGVRLSFQENIPKTPGCVLPGWVVIEGAITSGGQALPGQPAPPARFLPMAVGEWHTVRADLNADGTFDVWIDGGGSDWKHISGTTEGTGETCIRFGVTDESFETHGFSTACVAWGEGNVEIPAAPAGAEEICDNGVDDEDDDLDADCDDADCDCRTIADVCAMFVDLYEDFDGAFVPDPVTGAFSVVPEDWTRSSDEGDYTSPAYTDREGGTYTLEGGALRWRIAMDDLGVDCRQPDPDPGDPNDPYDTMCTGTFTLERAASAQDIASMPIDWSRPIILAADVQGSDLTTGHWEPFVRFEGYTGTRTSYEWGTDGLPLTYSKIGFATVMYELDPGQQSVTGAEVKFGVDFDFRNSWYDNDKTDIAFVENVRLIYHIDPAVPILRLDTTSLVHTVAFADPVPDDAFLVMNSGGGTLSYSISDDAGWLSVDQDSGSLSGGQADEIHVSYDKSGLVPGVYSATITVADPAAFASPGMIDVSLSLTVLPPDYDGDGDVDQEDYGLWQSCLTGDGAGLVEPGFCAMYADLDSDTDVDALDSQLFESCATGPHIAYTFGETCVLADWP